MIRHCPQLKIQLKNIKSQYDAYILELEQAKNSKEHEKALNIQPKLTQLILILKFDLDPEKYTEEYISRIEIKNKNHIALTKDDLIFLYDIDYNFHSYKHYYRGQRIFEILDNREDQRADLASLTDYPKEQISITQEAALSGNVKYHYGSLYLKDLTSAEGLKLPNIISGSLDLGSLTSAEGLKLPNNVGCNLALYSLISADGLKLPDSIGGDLNFHSLKSIEGLKLPDKIGGNLYFNRLKLAQRTKLRKDYPNLKIV